jgi:hypothetical protein
MNNRTLGAAIPLRPAEQREHSPFRGLIIGEYAFPHPADLLDWKRRIDRANESNERFMRKYRRR